MRKLPPPDGLVYHARLEREGRPGVKIGLDEVKKVAALAHLQLTDAELERLRAELDQILLYVDKLSELDTEGVVPAIGLPGLGPAEQPTLRPDKLEPTLSTEAALANAPESGNAHFKVPRVIG
jgi:aspartyl-tRNA(Asn)/glutamyl-tRNA(Gln) amidotransferase subunit C